MSRRRSLARNAAEYVLCRSVLGLMSVLPESALPTVARACGLILDGVLRGRRRVVVENVRIAFEGSGSAPDPRQLSRASFANLCRSFLELSRVPRRPDRLQECIRTRENSAAEAVREVLRTGPVVFAASHFGAYEFAGLATRPCLGFDLLTLIRPLDNPWLDAWLGGIRCRFGQRLASNRGGARELLDALHAGTSVAVLVDLNQRRRCVFVDYFGRPAATAPTAAQLAWRVRRPLVPVFAHRTTRPMRVEIEFGSPIWPRPEAGRGPEIHRLLQEATSEVEARVRAAPAQWLWTHRRWKTRPPGESGPAVAAPALRRTGMAAS